MGSQVPVTGLCVLIGVALFAAGCSHARFYAGDGTFTDRGWLAYSGRYSIDLGPVSLGAPGTYTYRLNGLPRAQMNVAVSLTEERPNGIGESRPSHPTRVRVELRDCDNQLVILEEGSLDTWVRSFAQRSTESKFYRGGESKDVPLPGGGTRGERLGLKASGGWGTYFNAEPGCEYRLKFDVLPSTQYSQRPSRLVVDGWDRM